MGKYHFRGDYEDLYQAGALGLQKALNKYDTARESSFFDYAYFYVKGEVLKELNNTSQVKVSADMIKLQRDINKTSKDLAQTFGREATSSEIAYVLGETKEKIEEARSLTKSTYSLDQTEPTEEINLYQKIAKIEMGYDAGILDLKTALLGLEASERNLITSRYYEEKTQKEIANDLGISQCQISRTEKKILAKLRDDLVTS